MLSAAWLKSMSSSSACQESWFGRQTTERLVRPQVGGAVGNEAPGRVLPCQGPWLCRPESNPRWEAHVGSSRGWFCCWSCRSLLSLTTRGCSLPRLLPGSWFVLWLSPMGRCWHGASRIVTAGLPPYIWGLLIYTHCSVASLMCSADQSCAVYSCSSPISSC